MTQLSAGMIIKFQLANTQLHSIDGGPASQMFQQYLNIFEIDSMIRQEAGLAQLSTPMIYLPVGRSGGGIPSSVELHNFDEHAQKRSCDAATSRNPGASLVHLAIGRMAGKYRDLLETEDGAARNWIETDPNLKDLTSVLKDLGYEWSIEPAKKSDRKSVV